MIPVTIPKTRKNHYISFGQALNLRLPDEDTGGWHQDTAFGSDDGKRRVHLAGPEGHVDTTPALGELGVRDMAEAIDQIKLKRPDGPVYVANHYRAIADIAMVDLVRCKKPAKACNATINQWLDTEQQILELQTKYLLPLRAYSNQAIFDEWFKTICFT